MQDGVHFTQGGVQRLPISFTQNGVRRLLIISTLNCVQRLSITQSLVQTLKNDRKSLSFLPTEPEAQESRACIQSTNHYTRNIFWKMSVIVEAVKETLTVEQTPEVRQACKQVSFIIATVKRTHLCRACTHRKASEAAPLQHTAHCGCKPPA